MSATSSIVDLNCSTTYDRWEVARWYLEASCEDRHARMTVSKTLVAAFPELMHRLTDRLIEQVRPSEPELPYVTAQKAFVNELMTMCAAGTSAFEVFNAVESFYRFQMNGERQ